MRKLTNGLKIISLILELLILIVAIVGVICKKTFDNNFIFAVQAWILVYVGSIERKINQ